MKHRFPKKRVSRLLEGCYDGKVTLHTEDDFGHMVKIGAIAARTLDYITPHVKPGISTAQLDRLLEDFMRDAGTIPATIGYNGYRHASCISVGHVCCHGIPTDKKILKDGDIVNIDITPKLNDWHGDTSRMYLVGDKVSVKARRLCEVTYEALQAGIKVAQPGRRLGEIGAVCEEIARRHGFSVATEFCGHGIGQTFHPPPQVVHVGPSTDGPVLRPGMFFTIEPIFNLGKPDIKVLSDGWTAVTRDRSLSAQWEHTIGITENGNVIFTA